VRNSGTTATDPSGLQLVLANNWHLNAEFVKIHIGDDTKIEYKKELIRKPFKSLNGNAEIAVTYKVVESKREVFQEFDEYFKVDPDFFNARIAALNSQIDETKELRQSAKSFRAAAVTLAAAGSALGYGGLKIDKCPWQVKLATITISASLYVGAASLWLRAGQLSKNADLLEKSTKAEMENLETGRVPDKNKLWAYNPFGPEMPGPWDNKNLTVTKYYSVGTEPAVGVLPPRGLIIRDRFASDTAKLRNGDVLIVFPGFMRMPRAQ
jgi:hypothetical protein